MMVECSKCGKGISFYDSMKYELHCEECYKEDPLEAIRKAYVRMGEIQDSLNLHKAYKPFKWHVKEYDVK